MDVCSRVGNTSDLTYALSKNKESLAVLGASGDFP